MLIPKFIMNKTSIVALILMTLATANASTLYTNILVNPGAEDGLTGWTGTGDPMAISYSYGGGYPTLATPMIPEPADRGQFFFAGGRSPLSTISQTIDLSFLDTERDAYKFLVSGWMGGFANQGDWAKIDIHFLAEDSSNLASFTLGPVTNIDRNDITSFLYREFVGKLPLKAASVTFTVTFSRIFSGGPDNDGYADELSFMVVPASPALSIVKQDGYSLSVSALIPGWTHVLETSTSLAPRTWTTHTEWIATGAQTNIPISMSGEKQFFRLRARP